MVEPCDFLSQLLELPLQAAPNEGVVRLQQSPPLGVALFDQLLTPPDQGLQTDLRGATVFSLSGESLPFAAIAKHGVDQDQEHPHAPDESDLSAPPAGA